MVKGWQMNPSATSPATSVIAGPTPARKMRGTPTASTSLPVGEKNGVISVCV